MVDHRPSKPSYLPGSAGGKPRPLATVEVSFLPSAAAGNAPLVARLTELINKVYARTEGELWQEGVERITTGHLATLIRQGHVAVARTPDGSIAGCIRTTTTPPASELGLLAAAPERWGAGIGTALMRFAEDNARAAGGRSMRLQLLVPVEATHPFKAFLDAWYRRLGYEVVDDIGHGQMPAERAALLATPCTFLVYEKPLDPGAAAAERSPG